MNLTVLGAGNGGQALAGHLALLGNDVVLFEHPDFPKTVESIRKNGKKICLEGVISGIGNLRSVTNDISEAVRHSQILFFVMPSYAQERIFSLCLPFLRKDQLVMFLPGNFASLAAKKILHNHCSQQDGITLAETDTIPYACRQLEPGYVKIWGVKNYLWAACLPGTASESMFSFLNPVFPIVVKQLQNVINVGFANTNMILHCTTMIMNTGRIEAGERFRFYTEGMTPSVCKMMEGMDRERLEVGSGYGLSLISEYEDAASNYPLDETYGSLYEILHHSSIYSGHGPDSPSDMKHRYLSEDVPYLLVPVSEFGSLAKIPTPLIDAIILISETINNTKYSEHGRTLESMGLGGMNVKQILDYVT